MKVHKELQPLVDRATRHGWHVETCNGGHIRFVRPNDGRSFFTAATPSDYRAVKNFEATLRREGLPATTRNNDEACTKERGLTCRCGATTELVYLVRGYLREVAGRTKRTSVLRASCPKHNGKTKRDMDEAATALLGSGPCYMTPWYVTPSRDDADRQLDALREQVSR